MMSEPKRLHPIAAIIHFVKGLKEAVLPVIVVLFLNGNLAGGEVNWIPLMITCLFLLLVLIGGVIRWFRSTYRIEEGEFRIEHGLILKKKRYIPIDRIQSLNVSEGIFHRPFQLVKVSIETAGSTGAEKAEAELTAIKRLEADELEAFITKEKYSNSHRRSADPGDRLDERRSVYKMSLKDIVGMAITSGGIGVVLSGIGVFLSQFLEFLPLEAVYQEVMGWIQIGILVVGGSIVLGLVIAYGISILLTVLWYANFVVYLDGEDVVITKGLLEKKQVTIPLNRIQGIRIDENLVRQPLGYASVTIISAGGLGGKGSEHQLRLLPFLRKKDIPWILNCIFTDYYFPDELHVLPARSKYRYILRYSWFAWIGAVAVSIYFWPLGLLAIAIAATCSLWGGLAFRDAGWSLKDNQLTLRNRLINKRTFIMKKNRVQTVFLSQSIFQKKPQLNHLKVTMKSGVEGAHASCYFIDQRDGEMIMEWYRPD